MTRILRIIIFLVAAIVRASATERCPESIPYNCGYGPFFTWYYTWSASKTTIVDLTMPKLGINKPISITQDYIRGMCDSAAIAIRADMSQTLIFYYDDGSASFDCAHMLYLGAGYVDKVYE